MDLNSPQDAHLRELLDALRPASDDLSRSEFAELAQRLQRDPQFKEMAARSQRLDQAISDCLHDLPIPSGSVDRLLARLDVPSGPAKQAMSGVNPAAEAAGAKVAPAANPHRQPLSAGDSPVKTSGATSVAPSAAEKNSSVDIQPGGALPVRISKMRLIEIGVLAVAASLAAVAYLFTGSPEALDAHRIVGEAQNFAAAESRPFEWQPMPAENPPALLTKFAFATGSGLTVRPSGWREVHDLLSRSGVAYELRSGKFLATLYVVERDTPSRFAPRFEDLPATPPSSALVDSGEKAFSTWIQGKLLYVLVVDGGPQNYKAFVAQPNRLAAL